MRLREFYPIIVTDKLVECRDYVRFIESEAGFWERYPPTR